jgi:Holliday junction resolvasome RuvABC DNA-binding subunit
MIHSAFQEALDALVALGFNRLMVEKTLMKVSQDLGSEAGTEALIKNCLKLL